MENKYQVEFRLLGPVEVLVDAQRIELGGSKQRALAAYLATHAGKDVRTPHLINAVWGDDAPDGAIRSLRTYVSTLRRLLGPTVTLTGTHGSYRLEDGAIHTDVDEFRRIVREVEGEPDHHVVSENLDTALGLWRGPFLADIDRGWVSAEASSLGSERERVVARWADAMIATGNPAHVVPVIEHAISESPFNEQLIGLLMRALYSSGRHADALAVYRKLRTALAAELGLEPGPELRQLEEQILLHDTVTVGNEAKWMPPASSAELVGRDAAMDDLLERIQQVRMLTLTGPGGVGKTRLAIELGRRIVDDGDQPVFFADLSAVQDETAVDAVLESSARVQSHPDDSELEGLIKYLRPRSAVLIADSCEHVTPTIARCLAALVRGCPQLTVVATSRSPLHIDGEFAWRTPSLAVPDLGDDPLDELPEWPAIQLLLQRAPSTFALTSENAGDVVELCRSLDGLPLALEIAASRLGSMTPAEILANVDSRVQLSLADSAEGSRHSTLEATAGWSFDLLSESGQRLLVCLSVMSGWFLLEDAHAVCAAEGESLDTVQSQLSTLVDESLVIAEASGTRTRYRLLETIRRFSIRLLGSEQEAVRSRHAHHFADLAEAEGIRLSTKDEAAAVVELSSAYDNLRSAINWAMETGDIESASRIVASLPDWGYWRGRTELAKWAQWVWENTTSADATWRAVCGSAARGAWVEGRFDDALRFGRSADGHPGRVIARCGHPDDVVADVALYRGDAGATLHHYSLVAKTANQAGDASGSVWGAYYVSIANTVLQRRSDAAEAAAAALAGARELGNPSELAVSLYANGLAVKHANVVEAIAYLEEAVRMGSSVDNSWFAGIARMELAYARVRHGETMPGFVEFAAVIDQWQRSGDETLLRHTWRYLARVLTEAGIFDAAAVLCGALLADTRSTLIHPHDRVLRELTVELGDARYRRLTVRGSIMSIPELVTVSLDAIDQALRDEPAPSLE